MSLDRFPRATEVEEAVAKFIGPDYVRAFFQRRGILIVSLGREPFAEIGKRLFLDYDDFEELHDLATTGSPGRSISGFDLVPSDDDEDEAGVPDTDGFLEALAKTLETVSSPDYSLYELSIGKDNILQGTMEYQHRSPGKYELVGKVDSKVEFRVREKTSSSWEVLFFPERITDQKMLESVVIGSLSKGYQVRQHHLHHLPQKDRIEFFDNFLKYQFSEWHLEDVVGVKVRQPETAKVEDDLDDVSVEPNGEAEELEKDQLRSITEAILKGENLRTNPFVKQFEDSGYYFQAMTIRFKHAKTPVMIDLLVNFKLRPISLELSLDHMFRVVNGKLDKNSGLPRKKQLEILAKFWEVARTLLAAITKT